MADMEIESSEDGKRRPSRASYFHYIPTTPRTPADVRPPDVWSPFLISPSR